MLLQESPKFMFILLYIIEATTTTIQLVLSKTEGSNFELPNSFGTLDVNEDYHFKKNHFGRYWTNANNSNGMLFQ